MISGSKETLCTNCSHLKVCSKKEQYLNAQQAVNQVVVCGAENTIIELHRLEWIKPVRLMCAYFENRKPAERTPFEICGNREFRIKCMEDPD